MRFENITNKDGFYITTSIPGTDAATSENYGIFFIATRPCEVLKIAETHTNAGSDASAALNVERLQGTEDLNSGDEICVDDFNLNGVAAYTTTTKSSTELQNTKLDIDDKLALKDVGTITNVAGVCVTIYFRYIGKGDYR